VRVQQAWDQVPENGRRGPGLSPTHSQPYELPLDRGKDPTHQKTPSPTLGLAVKEGQAQGKAVTIGTERRTDWQGRTDSQGQTLPDLNSKLPILSGNAKINQADPPFPNIHPGESCLDTAGDSKRTTVWQTQVQTTALPT
jgi:hypothetical protein